MPFSAPPSSLLPQPQSPQASVGQPLLPPRRGRRFLRALVGVGGCAAALLLVTLSARALSGRGAGQGGPTHSGLPFHVMQRPGYLGVSLRDLDAAEATRLHRRGPMGAMIITVDRDAPAWTAGLRPQDVVLEMNGQPIDGVEAFRKKLRECQPSDTITLRVRRGDDEMTYAVTLGDEDQVAQHALSQHLRPGSSTFVGTLPVMPAGSFTGPGTASAPAPTPAAPQPPARGMASTLFDALIPGSIYTGLEVSPLTPQLASFFGVPAHGGLLVSSVNVNSPAANAGLLAGDVILRASNREVSTRSELAHALRSAKGDAVPLAVLRERKETIVTLVPEKRKKL